MFDLFWVGFFKSISLTKDNLQDTLRLLTIWFQYGHLNEVSNTIYEGFNTVPIYTWLSVIPQLIARIHTGNLNVRKLVHYILTEVGKLHPQALVYPLTVASKSHSVNRKNAALMIITKMQNHSSILIEQVILWGLIL